ncbi:MAG: sulfatase-like hydrolase/transferase [Patescibacteria group bacterium]
MRFPHVVLIVVDSLRADTADLARMPFIERRAVCFRQARSPGCWTAPATGSIFTGRFPHEHGLETRSRTSLNDDLPTLAQRFLDAGYRTCQVTANGVTQMWGLNRGFETIECVWKDLPTIGWVDKVLLTLSRPRLRKLLFSGNRVALESDISSSKVWLRDTAPIVFYKTHEHLRTHRAHNEHSFLFLNLMETHFPYHVDEVVRMTADGWINKARELKGLIDLVNERWLTKGQMTISTEILALLRSRQTRAWLRLAPKLDAFVEEISRHDDTIIIICSDHGECFGEDGMNAYHFGNLTEAGNRVPLFLIDPHQRAFTIETPICTNDLYGTILRRAGIIREGIDLVTESHRSIPIMQSYWHPVKRFGKPTHENYRHDDFGFVENDCRFIWRAGHWHYAEIRPIHEREALPKSLGHESAIAMINDSERRRQIGRLFEQFLAFSADQPAT